MSLPSLKIAPPSFSPLNPAVGIAFYPKLGVLQLHRIEVDARVAQLVLSILVQRPEIESLQISSCEVRGEGMTLLAAILLCRSSLSGVTFFQCDLDKAASAVFARVFCGLQVEAVTLIRNEIDLKDLGRIASSLADNQVLRILYVDQPEIPREPWADAIRENISVREAHIAE